MADTPWGSPGWGEAQWGGGDFSVLAASIAGRTKLSPALQEVGYEAPGVSAQLKVHDLMTLLAPTLPTAAGQSALAAPTHGVFLLLQELDSISGGVGSVGLGRAFTLGTPAMQGHLGPLGKTLELTFAGTDAETHLGALAAPRVVLGLVGQAAFGGLTAPDVQYDWAVTVDSLAAHARLQSLAHTVMPILFDVMGTGEVGIVDKAIHLELQGSHGIAVTPGLVPITAVTFSGLSVRSYHGFVDKTVISNILCIPPLQSKVGRAKRFCWDLEVSGQNPGWVLMDLR